MATVSSSSKVTLEYTKGVDSNVTTRGSNTLTLTRSRTGTELPRHKILIRDGSPATTALSAYDQQHIGAEYLGGYMSCRRKGYTQVEWSTRNGMQPTMPDLTTVTQSLVDAAVSDARSRAYSKLHELQTPYNGLVFLGEIKETKDLLKDPFGKSLKLLKSLLEVRKANPRMIGSAIASSWLEFQFALLPLISEVDQIIRIIADQVEIDKRRSFRFFGEASSSTTTTSLVLELPYCYARIETTLESKAENFLRFGHLVACLEHHNDISARLTGAYGKLSSVPVTAWELLPWSFLVDYFTNVQEIITSATTGTMNVTWQSNAVVKTVKKTVRSVAIQASSGTYETLEHRPRRIVTQHRSVERNSNALGIPSLRFSLPGSNMQYANLAALLASLKL